MPNIRKNVEKSATTHGENTGDSTSDFNVVMDEKFEEFKSFTFSKLTERMKNIIQMEVQGILKGYMDQLEKVTSTIEIL